MTHILLDIKYKHKESVLYDKNRGESIINNWCEYNNHLLVMPPVSHVFPCYEQNDYNGYTSIGLLKESHISIHTYPCLLYTSPSPRDRTRSRMPSSA